MQNFSHNSTDGTRDKTAFWWCLYDFANSFILVAGGVHFQKWYILDLGGRSLDMNMGFLFSAVFVLAFSPRFGRYLDKISYYGTSLLITSLVLFISTLGIFAVSLVGFSDTEVRVLVYPLYLISLIAYQFSIIVHSTVLSRAFSADRVSKVSGLGAAANWSGSLAGIVVSALFVQSEIPNLLPGRANAFLIAPIVFLILAFTAILFMANYGQLSRKIGLHPQQEKDAISIRALGTIMKSRFLILFFLGLILYMDAAITIEINLPTIFSLSYLISDSEQTPILVAILLAAAIGGLLGGVFKTFRRSADFVIPILMTLFALAALLVGMLPSARFLLFVSIVAGFSIGALEAVTRSVFLARTPSAMHGEFLAYFVTFQRLASVVGPLAWVATVGLLGETGDSYRTAVLVQAGIAAIGAAVICASAFVPKSQTESTLNHQ